MFKEALATQRRAVELSGGSAVMLGWLGLMLGGIGEAAEARDVLQRLHGMAAKGYVPPCSFARIEGQIHSDPGEAGLADQGQNARAECPTARPSVTDGNGNPDGHFLRKLKAIAKKAGVEGAELHRFRKTYADTLHEEDVSVNTIRIRLGHESLDVTLAYLKGKDAESEEAQEHANSSSLALYA